MKVIFLDIDGVVNTLMIYKNNNDKLNLKKGNDGYFYDICSHYDLRVSNTQAIVWLDKICHDFNLSIVISSTWRYDYEDTCKSLYNSGLSEDIKILGATKIMHKARGIEIQDFLDSHPFIDDFIILDDDSDMEHLINHLIKVNTYTGLNYNHYLAISDYFKGDD